MQNQNQNFYKLDLLSIQKMNNMDQCHKMYEIPLKAEAIAAHNGLLLSRQNNTIKIFKYSDKFTLTLIKTFNKSSLIFIERLLSNAAVILMYKIVLDLSSKNIEISEIEDYLCNLMNSLQFNKIKKVNYTSEYVIIRYKDNIIKIFDSKLNTLEVNEEFIDKCFEEISKISIKTIGNKISIRFNGESILTRNIDNILTIDKTGNIIFLLHGYKITVITLN